MEHRHASLLSQMENLTGEYEDTEEQFWLRMADDYQSKVTLGNSLAAEYRFREAIAVYSEAAEIKSDDWMLFLRLGGAFLTCMEFEPALKCYEKCLELGAGEKAVAYQLGFWHYLQGDYGSAETWIERVLPCGDELKIAVIYWHSICRLRQGKVSQYLSEYHADMAVGHHTAYKLAVASMCGEVCPEQAMQHMMQMSSELDYVVALYGMLWLLPQEEREVKLDELLKRRKFWPCLSYLAAWQDHRLNRI